MPSICFNNSINTKSQHLPGWGQHNLVGVDVGVCREKCAWENALQYCVHFVSRLGALCSALNFFLLFCCGKLFKMAQICGCSAKLME